MTIINGKGSSGYPDVQGTGNAFLDLLMMAAGFAMVFTAIAGAIHALLLVATSVSMLTAGVSGGFGAKLVTQIMMGAATGAVVGVVVVVYRMCVRKPSHAEKSILSALFAKGIETFQFDSLFWGRVVIGAVVGVLIGLMASGNGAVGPFHWLAGTGVDPGSMMGKLMAGGGGSAGGSGGGGWGDFFGNLFLYGMGLLVLGTVVGTIAGFGVQLLLFAVAGATKGAVKEYVEFILEDAKRRGEYPDPKLATGAVRGAIAGTLTGVLFVIATALGSLKFVH